MGVCICGFCNMCVCVCERGGVCNVWVSVCVGFVMCGYVHVWVLQYVRDLVIRVLVFTVFCIVSTVFCIVSFMYIYSFFLSVLV